MKSEVDSIDESVVTLDTYNSDLNLVIDTSKYCAQPLTNEGFAFMWAGARATHGIKKGKVCFEVKLIKHLDVPHLPSDEPNPHVVRIGFSVDSATLQLGEEPQSYGYGGTAKISENCQFKDFGQTFKADDCILAVANMDSDPVEIGFGKNGRFIGWAFKIKKTELDGKALFPHVLTKNCSFEVNFGQKEKPFFPLPYVVKDYTFIGCLSAECRILGARPPVKREDCEIIMMCGLPGAGKSVWAAEYSKKNPQKRYNVLGTNNIIDKMKVMGLPRKRNYSGRWDVLIQMATKCLNTLFSIGSKLRRNYILDQTNVYPTAQRRKMRNFDDFKRKVVVVIPTEDEFKKRCDKRDQEEGKEIPDSAVLEMKANFKIPESGDIFNEVIFTELQRDEAEKIVKKYNEEGKSSIEPPRKQLRANETTRDYSGKESNRKHDSSASLSEKEGGSKMSQWRSKNNERVSFTDRNMRGQRDMLNKRGFAGRRGGFRERNRQSDLPRNFGERNRQSDMPRSFGERNRQSDIPKNFGERNRQSDIPKNFGEKRDWAGDYGFVPNPNDWVGDYEFIPNPNDWAGDYGFIPNPDDYRTEFGSYRPDSNYKGSDNTRFGNEEYHSRDQSSGHYTEQSSYGRFSGGESYDSRGRDFGRDRGVGRSNLKGTRGTSEFHKSSEIGNYNSQNYQDSNMSGKFGQDRKLYGDNNYNDPRSDYQSNSLKKYNANVRFDYNHMPSNSNASGMPRGGYTNFSRGSSNATGSKDYPEQKSDNVSYGENQPRDYNSRGLSHSSNRYQYDNRSTSTHHFQGVSNDSFSSSGYQTGKKDAQVAYSKDYGYSSGGYEESDKYQNNSSVFPSALVSQNIETIPLQRSETSGMNTTNKPISGFSGTSGSQSWSTEISQMPAVVSNSSYITYQPTSEIYSAVGVQSYAYSQNNQNNQATAIYQNKETYGYQQGMPSNVASSPWPGAATTTAISDPSSYTLPSQTSWPQYGQQPGALNEYYTK